MSSVINAESLRRCYKCGRSPAEDSLITLFRFPKPGKTNTLRCELWAKYCFPDKDYCSPEFQHKLHTQHKMLCNRHFPKTSFSDYPETSKKLHRFAVPGDIKEGVADSGDSGPVEETTGFADVGVSCPEEEPTGLADAGDSGPVEETTVDSTDICDDDDHDSDTLVESNVCRVCLALDVKMYDLKEMELREMFQNITGIVVPENNHSMLERLCWECAGRLKAAAAFRNKALLSDALLQGLANTGEQIRKNDVTLIKENQDYLKSAGTLSTVEVFHTVEIDAEYGITPISENNDTDNTVRKHLVELKPVIIKEYNDQMDVEDESMIEAPNKTVIEYDNIRPNTGDKNRNIVLETNSPFSNNISLRENTSNSAYSRPPLGIKMKKNNVKMTKKDTISKIAQEVINFDHILKGASKLKDKNLKVYGSSKKTLNQKLMKSIQDKPNTSTDDEYTDVEYLSLENFEF